MHQDIFAQRANSEQNSEMVGWEQGSSFFCSLVLEDGAASALRSSRQAARAYFSRATSALHSAWSSRWKTLLPQVQGQRRSLPDREDSRLGPGIVCIAGHIPAGKNIFWTAAALQGAADCYESFIICIASSSQGPEQHQKGIKSI